MPDRFSVIVPVRAGSKGMPNKNVTMLNGKPLYLHAVDLAIQGGAERIVISTDIDEILHAHFEASVEVVARPAHLCTDSAPMSPVLVHALQDADITGAVVLLQPTSPLRSSQDLAACLQSFKARQVDLVVTVTNSDSTVVKGGLLGADGVFDPFAGGKYLFSNRQSLPPVYRPNGAIYVFRAEWLRRHRDLSCADTILGVPMPSERSLDIDTAEDFALCAKILSETKEE